MSINGVEGRFVVDSGASLISVGEPMEFRKPAAQLFLHGHDGGGGVIS